MAREQQATRRARDAGRRAAELEDLLGLLRGRQAWAADDLRTTRRRVRRAELRAERARERTRSAMAAAAVLERRAARLWEARGDLERATAHARRAMECAAAGAASTVSSPSTAPPGLASREALRPSPSPAPASLLDVGGLGPHSHEALVVGSREAFLESVLPPVRESLAAGHHLVLACSEANARALASVVRDDARVVPTAMSRVHRDASVALAFYRGLITKRLRAGATGVCLVTQPDAAPQGRRQEWQRFEALCNHVLAGMTLRQLCVYDTRALTDADLVTAELCHPYLRDAVGRTANPGYVDPEEVLAPAGPGRSVERGRRPDLRIEDLHDFAAMRQRVRDLLRRHRVPGPVVDEFVHAVHEVAADAVAHGAAPVSVSVWLHPRRLVCTVTDRGPGLDDPFASVRAGQAESPPQRWVGLWVARRLCDELTTTLDDDGFTVRLVRLR